jgi:hypothetical protein
VYVVCIRVCPPRCIRIPIASLVRGNVYNSDSIVIIADNIMIIVIVIIIIIIIIIALSS